jgi:DNA-binding transcriptional ArsR family regulator
VLGQRQARRLERAGDRRRLRPWPGGGSLYLSNVTQLFVFSLFNPMHASHPVINPELLRSGAAQAVGVLKTLANEDRLMLMCQLSQGEHCVSELEEELGIAQPTLSQQLGVLRNEGVVTTRRQGKNIYYSVADPRTLEILVLLHRLYCPEGEN